MSFTIEESCSGCGRCTDVCPSDAIVRDGETRHVVDPVLCIDCGACAIVCSDDAVRDERGQRFAIQGLCGSKPMRAIVRIEHCTGCGDCVTSCTFNAILRVLVTGRSPHARVIESRCTGCAVCAIECDKGAIELVCALSDEPE